MATKDKSKKNGVVKAETPSPYSPAQIKKFVQEVQVEFSKIVWPDKKVTMGLTGIVVVLTVVVAIYLGSVDLILGKLVSYLLR
ncbi:MAG: preprotein translocase subunit SecE [Desulfopila sp.]|nr:preprotein translocase subunit SecE [Desulfopila sp.]